MIGYPGADLTVLTWSPVEFLNSGYNLSIYDNYMRIISTHKNVYPYSETQIFTESLTFNVSKLATMPEKDQITILLSESSYIFYIKNIGNEIILTTDPPPPRMPTDPHIRPAWTSGNPIFRSENQTASSSNTIPFDQWDRIYALIKKEFPDKSVYEVLHQSNYNETFIEEFIEYVQPGIFEQIAQNIFFLPRAFADVGEKMVITGNALVYDLDGNQIVPEGLVICAYDVRNDGTFQVLTYNGIVSCDTITTASYYTISATNIDYDDSTSQVDLILMMDLDTDVATIQKNTEDPWEFGSKIMENHGEYLTTVNLLPSLTDNFTSAFYLYKNIHNAHTFIKNNFNQDIKSVTVEWDYNSLKGNYGYHVQFSEFIYIPHHKYNATN